MRRLLLGLISAAMVVGLVAAGVVTAFLGGTASNRAWALPCLPTLNPTDPGEARSPVGPEQLDEEQASIATQIIHIGEQRQLQPRGWQIALQAGMTESRLRNLPYGDRDSIGIFQMRPSMGWGSIEQLLDTAYSINKFYDVLLEVSGWEDMRPGDAAQAVERSAFPDRYHTWEPLAVALIGQIGGVDNPGGCQLPPQVFGSVPPPTAAAGTAIAFALAQLGKPYVWGATGPSSFDCSGLMLRAYESAAIQLPRVSRQQFQAGAQLPVESAQPGDLLFWAYDESDPRTVHHVAMYLGGGQIVEAQQRGVPVHTRAVQFDEPELMPVAVRPGV
ncbi:MAG TPA: C40 family peptidase [Pseudonocardiaceae bacterium]|nr:C40 family peptidase [Pseudonocardiaceae bacterium]